MPTDAEGRWSPAAGWPALWESVVTASTTGAMDAAGRFMTVCREVGCAPQGVFDDWAYWYGQPKCGKVPNWPAYLTVKEWEQLATFAERDVAKRSVKAAAAETNSHPNPLEV